MMIKIKNLLKISILLLVSVFSMLSMADQDAADSLNIEGSEKNTDENETIKIENAQLEIPKVENVQIESLSGKENTEGGNEESKKSESINVNINETALGLNENSNRIKIIVNQKVSNSFESTAEITVNNKLEKVSKIVDAAKINEKVESEKEVILTKKFDSTLHFSSDLTIYENKNKPRTPADIVVKEWPIQNGEVISDAVGKWAALSGWSAPIWEAQELMATSNVVLLGTFEEAIQQMVESFERQGIVLRITFYSENKVIRIQRGNI